LKLFVTLHIEKIVKLLIFEKNCDSVCSGYNFNGWKNLDIMKVVIKTAYNLLDSAGC